MYFRGVNGGGTEGAIVPLPPPDFGRIEGAALLLEVVNYLNFSLKCG